MPELLADRYPPAFAKHVLGKHPAPIGPDTIDFTTGELVPGKQLWERGIRLQGQQQALIECPSRFTLAAGGVRAGKSFIGGLRIYLDFMWRVFERGVKDDLWGVLADTYQMAQEEMRHLARLLDEAGLPYDLRQPDNAAWRMRFPFCDAEIVTLTAGDVTKIASRPYRGIVIAEANQTVFQAYSNARDRVSQTRGWILLEGTFETQTKGPWYAQLWEDWQKDGAVGVSFSLPTWENLVLFPGGREDPEILAIEREKGPEVFMERYGGVPAKRSDLVMRYADERWQVRHRYPSLRASYDPEYPVYLFSDPGTSHAYALFAVQFWSSLLPLPAWASDPMAHVIDPPKRQGYNNVCWVIDAVYHWGRDAKQIIDEAANKPWAPNVEMAIMDIAARQRNANGPAVVEQWTTHWPRQTGNNLYVHTAPVPLHPGYDLHRRALLNAWPEGDAQRAFNHENQRMTMTDPEGPRLMIDPAAAAPLFGGMVDDRRYAGEYNLHHNRKAPDGTILRDDPVDTDNDGIKALTYGLWWAFGAAGTRRPGMDMGPIDWEMTVA